MRLGTPYGGTPYGIAGIALALVASLAVAGAQVPAPLPSASPLPSPTAVSPAGGTPAPKASFDRHELVLAPGASAVVHLFGASSVTLALSNSQVEARYDAPTRSVIITAHQLGDTTIVGTEAHGTSDTILVHVDAPAGVIPTDVTVVVAGTPAHEFLVARIRAEVKRLAHLCAACTLDLPTAATVDATLPAQPLDVRIKGPNAASVAGQTTLHLVDDVLVSKHEPVTLMYSDDPESVGVDGVLFRSTQPVDVDHPARLYAYHAAADNGRSIYLVVSTLGQQSDVQLVGATVGPYGDYNCVGHAATNAFLIRRIQPEGARVHATSDAPAVIPLNSRRMPARTLVAAIYDIAVVSGDPVRITVVSAGGDADPLTLLTGPEIASDGHARRGEYDLSTLKPLALNYAVGQADEPVLAVGNGAPDADSDAQGAELQPLRPHWAALHGEFGVLRSIALHMKNDTGSPGTVSLYATPANGPDTLNLWFAGDSVPTEIGRIADPNSRTLIRQFTLAPGTAQNTNVLFMADGASWFPIEVGLTAGPVIPAQPNAFDGCVRALQDQVGLAFP